MSSCSSSSENANELGESIEADDERDISLAGDPDEESPRLVLCSNITLLRTSCRNSDTPRKLRKEEECE